MKIRCDALLNADEVRQLLVEVAREQKQGIFQLVLMSFERPLAKTADRESGHDRDGGYQRDAAEDEPMNRTPRLEGIETKSPQDWVDRATETRIFLRHRITPIR